MKLDDMIASELINTLDERLAQYNIDIKKHYFSPVYRVRRYQTIRKYLMKPSSNKFSVRRVRFILLAIILAVFLLAGFSIWYTIGNFSFNIYSDHSVTYISNTTADKGKIEYIFGLSSDTSYTLVDRQSDDNDVFSIYQSGSNKITLCQMVNDEIAYFNTEYSSPEHIMINNYEGVFISENDECFVVWIMDDYLFTLSGNIDKKTVVDLAEATIVEKIVEIL